MVFDPFVFGHASARLAPLLGCLVQLLADRFVLFLGGADLIVPILLDCPLFRFPETLRKLGAVAGDLAKLRLPRLDKRPRFGDLLLKRFSALAVRRFGRKERAHDAGSRGFFFLRQRTNPEAPLLDQVLRRIHALFKFFFNACRLLFAERCRRNDVHALTQLRIEAHRSGRCVQELFSKFDHGCAAVLADFFGGFHDKLDLLLQVVRAAPRHTHNLAELDSRLAVQVQRLSDLCDLVGQVRPERLPQRSGVFACLLGLQH